ncbi:MAG TPA: tetratricopeptide repeat protein [Fimbriimonadaceae bacterium]|nr:tetratricopeptide repeat protein [Fimbriimonadaceae bacterium]
MAAYSTPKIIRPFVVAFAALVAFMPAPGQVVSQDRNDADSAFAAQEYKKAIPLYRKVVEENSLDAEAWFRLGYSLHTQRQFRDAIDAYQKALDMKYFTLTTRYDIASAYARLGDKDRSMKSLRDAVLGGYFVPQQIRSDRDFRDYQGDPEYEHIIEMARDGIKNYANNDHLDWLLHRWTAGEQEVSATLLSRGFAVALVFTDDSKQTTYVFLTFDAIKSTWNAQGAGDDDATYTGIVDAVPGALTIHGTTVVDGKEVDSRLRLASENGGLTATWQENTGGRWVDQHSLGYSEGPATLNSAVQGNG